MVQHVITPWRHQSELIEVREKLYGNGKDVDGMRRAVEAVGVWSRFSSLSGSLISDTCIVKIACSFILRTCYRYRRKHGSCDRTE